MCSEIAHSSAGPHGHYRESGMLGYASENPSSATAEHAKNCFARSADYIGLQVEHRPSSNSWDSSAIAGSKQHKLHKVAGLQR